jgi:hypothetical protein
MPYRDTLIGVDFIVFLLAAIWPALPQSAQDIKINLTALGLALLVLSAFLLPAAHQ